MNNVHDDQPVVFQTRWTLSYLRGPLTREQIQTLMAPRKQATDPGTEVPDPITELIDGPGSHHRRRDLGRRHRDRHPWPAAVPARWCRRTFPCSSCRDATRARARRIAAVSARAPGRGPAPLRREEGRRRLLGDAGLAPAGLTTPCRRSPGTKASRSTTACPSWTRLPRPGLDSPRCPPSWPGPRAMPSGPSP